MEEITVKGMILSAAPQGEYGRRLTMLTDRLGKITTFASGAAKAGSRLMGKVRPFTAAAFTLARGRGAYNIHGAEIIDSFEEIPLDPDVAMYGFYVLELAEYFSAEGMAETDARELLNLSFMALKALREKGLRPELVMTVLKLRLLKLCGEYTQLPPVTEDKLTVGLWRQVLSAPLSRVFSAETLTEKNTAGLEKSTAFLFKKQVPHKFRTAGLLEAR